MKKKKYLIGGALVLVLGFLVFSLTVWPPLDVGNAVGIVKKGARQDLELQKELWGEFSRFEKSFLSAYADQFAEQPDDPMELVAAFNELAYGITGHGGLWRKTVPNKFFGCQADDEQRVCLEFKQAEAEFQRWDRLQEMSSEIHSRRQAVKFLKDHHKDIQEYLSSMVPGSESLSAVEATPFFARRIAPAL